MGKTKIPKNRSLREMYEQDESMKEEIKKTDKKKQFIENLKKANVEKIELEVNENKLNNYYERRDAQAAERKRKEEYIKAINKLQEQEEK